MNIFDKVGLNGEPMAILSCWEYIFELNLNCTPLVDNFKSLRKLFLLILGVPSLYSVSTHISNTSSSGTFVNKLLTSKEVINVLFQLILFIWSVKENESFNILEEKCSNTG